MREMAVGLQKKNVILRNELRHLKRSLAGETPAQHLPPSRGYNTCVLPSYRTFLPHAVALGHSGLIVRVLVV